jgi:hypothetical protein
MKAEIEILKRNTDFTSNNTVTRAVAKAVAVMQAWEELRREVSNLFVISGPNTTIDCTVKQCRSKILTKMDSLVPPEPVDELDQLREFLERSREINVIHCGREALKAEIARIKSGRGNP